MSARPRPRWISHIWLLVAAVLAAVYLHDGYTFYSYNVWTAVIVALIVVELAVVARRRR